MQYVESLEILHLKVQSKPNINKTYLLKVTIKLQNDDLCLNQESKVSHCVWSLYKTQQKHCGSFH